MSRRGFRAAAAAAACASAIAGVAATSGSGFGPPEDFDPYGVEELTPRQLAGARIVCGFAGTQAPQSLVRAVGDGEVGGVILFERNIRSRSQVAAMSRAIQGAPRPAALSAPVIVSIDQEGGQVKRLPGAPSTNAVEMGRRGPEFSRQQGAATGTSLKGVGVNVDFAPVLDVARPGGFIEDQQRAFGTKPGRVASAATAFAEGLQGAGVAATAKHFPGLGSTAANTDLRPARIPLKAGVLRSVDERPYESFIAADGKLVMVGSARYPALRDPKLPASQSKPIVQGELRRRLGFTGVTVTDSMETPSVNKGTTPAKAAVRAAAAGMDVLLYVHCDAGVRAARALRNALATGKLKRPAFEGSVERILALRSGL